MPADIHSSRNLVKFSTCAGSALQIGYAGSFPLTTRGKWYFMFIYLDKSFFQMMCDMNLKSKQQIQFDRVEQFLYPLSIILFIW